MDASEHDHRRDDDLSEELPTRAELEEIVDETDRHPEQSGDRGECESRRADLLRDKERMTREPVDEPEDEDRRSECHSDRKTTGTRDRAGMPPSAAGHIEHPEPARE